MKRLSLVVAAVACWFGATAQTPAAINDPVRLDSGLVSGTTASSQVRVFRGIPYAAPPVGDLRWKAPQAPAHWSGVRKAEEFGARCMQASPGGGGGQPPTSEDCLFINVWTAAASANERLPVMVFTYGGAFTSGAGSDARYDGDALAKKGVVVVTSNYRLGAFGWFAHPELTKESGHNASGNYGLMDAVAALRWVQQNIAAFGGDPRNVTIFGESAGAVSVAAMVGSPEAKGLFKRAIAESGGWMGLRMGRMTTLPAAEETGVRMLQAMGTTTVAGARALPAQEILQKGRPGGVIVDGWYVPEDLSLTFSRGRQNDVDVLVGSNQDEGTFFERQGPAAAAFVKQIQDRWGDLSDAFLKLYPAASDEEAGRSSLNTQRDEMTWHARLWAAATHKRGKKAWVYYFTHVPPTASPNQPSRGATHTAELAYVFGNLLPATREWPDVDKRLAERMTTYWTNFARTGDPNGSGLPLWPGYRDKGTNGRAMILGDTVEAEAAVDTARLALYDALYSRQVTPGFGQTASR